VTPLVVDALHIFDRTGGMKFVTRIAVNMAGHSIFQAHYDTIHKVLRQGASRFQKFARNNGETYTGFHLIISLTVPHARAESFQEGK